MRHHHDRGWAVLSGADGLVVARSKAPMVGRGRELRFVLDRLEDAREGKPRGAVVVGPAGIGKSRLAREVRTRARALGFQDIVVEGPHDAHVPYFSAARQLVPFLLDAFAGDSVYRADVQILEELCATMLVAGRRRSERAVPLRRLAYQGGPPRPRDDTTQRLLTITRLTLEMAQRHPLLLVVEDLHEVDPATVVLLDQLLVTAARVAVHEPMPLAVVTLGRPGDQDHAGAVDRMGRVPGCEVVRLEPFDRLESLELLGALGIDTDSDREATEALVAASGGSPLFLESASRLLFATAGPVADVALPATLDDAVGRDLDLLDDDVQALLGDLALIGESVPLDRFAALVESDGPALVSALAPAEEAGVIEVVDGTVRFTHALRRQAAASMRGGAARQRRHVELARRIEQVTGGAVEPADRLAVARHLVAAGDQAPAGEVERWAADAARGAFDQRAWHDAARLYEAAAEAHRRDHPDGADGRRLGALLLGAARAWFAALEMARASGCARRAADLLAAAGDHPDRAAALLVAARCDLYQGRYGAASDSGDDLRGLYDDERLPVALRTEAGVIASELAWAAGDTGEAARLADNAQQVAHDEHLDALESAALVSRATVAWLTLDLRAALGLLEEARRLAECIGDDLGTVIAEGRYAYTRWLLGDVDQAVDTARRALTWAGDAGHELERTMPLAVLTGVAVAAGDHAAAELRADEAMMLHRASGDTWTAPFVAGPLIYRAALVGGGSAESITDLVDALANSVDGELGRGVAMMLALWSRAMAGEATAGDVDLLSSLEASRGADLLPANSVGMPALCAAWVESVDLLGLDHVPAVVAERLREADERGQRIGSTFPVVLARVLATTARLVGAHDVAEAQARRALATCERFHLDVERARTHHELARVLWQTGRTEEANSQVAAFAAEARRCRLDGLVGAAVRSGGLPEHEALTGWRTPSPQASQPVVVAVTAGRAARSGAARSPAAQVQRHFFRGLVQQAEDFAGRVQHQDADALVAWFPTVRVGVEFAQRVGTRAQRIGTPVGLGVDGADGAVTELRATEVARSLAERSVVGEVLVSARVAVDLERRGSDVEAFDPEVLVGGERISVYRARTGAATPRSR